MPLAPAVQPHHYPLVPLSQVPSTTLAPVGMSPATKRALILLAILIVVLVAITVFSKKPVKRNSRMKRRSTPELARNLYERLERRGGANETTMRSLQAYASKR
jgi:hypothetical protein